MDSTALHDLFRSEVRDEATPYLWSDAEIYSYIDDAQKMFCLLTSKGYTLGDDLDYYFDRGAGHNEWAWANRLERPLRYFFGK